MMLVCEACDKGYHTFCMEPAIEGLPADSWKCKVRPALAEGVTGVPTPRLCPPLTCLYLHSRTVGSAWTAAGGRQGLTLVASGTGATRCARAASSAAPQRTPTERQHTCRSWTHPPRREWE